MAKNMGWIKLHRQLVESSIWDDEEPFDRRSAWIDLLLLANHEDKQMVFDGHPIIVKRGQRITSVRKLADRWKWGKNKTLAYLRLLESLQMISRNADSRKTLITIVNYENYQDYMERSRDTDRDSGGTVAGHRQATNKNDKELKNDKKIYNDIMNTFNQTCISLPKIKTLGARREEALDELISTYSLEEIQQIFIKAQASPFLRGDTGNGWKATFDWLIKPDNASKVLSDTYVAYEKKSESGQPKNAFHNFTERNNDYEQLERLLLEHNKREVNNMISRRYE